MSSGVPAGKTTVAEEALSIERPVPSKTKGAAFGSDAIAETIRDLGVEYVALNPGASFRGLHDSLVNHLGNEGPSMLLCLHEEHAVAIAHGWAKVKGRPMAAIAHSNVGLMHATMAVFNAWCDRMPLILLGATGPVDAAKRRPWIEWIHTSADQGALLRGYTKWDDQPASVKAARESLIRAAWISETSPQGPVYVNLDAGLQEQKLDGNWRSIPDVGRYRPLTETGAGADAIDRIAAMLEAAERPVILAGRTSRSKKAWDLRVSLAEILGAQVLTDLKIGTSFPTDHPLHAGAPGIYATPEASDILGAADVVLSLDWVDLAGTLDAAFAGEAPDAKIIQISQDHTVHNGWNMDHQALPPVDVLLSANPDDILTPLVARLSGSPRRHELGEPKPAPERPALTATKITMAHLAAGLDHAAGEREISFVHLPLGWDGSFWHFNHPLDFLGSDGGGGIGGGPGISVGAALALKGSSRLPVCIGGDGDFLMGATAIWTAARYRIPLLYIVANNMSFFNDEVHQERMAKERGHPVENKGIGIRVEGPEVDIAAMARAQGATGLGPVETADKLEDTLREAIALVEAGETVIVDIRTQPGYTPAMVNSLGRHAGGKS